MIKQYLLVLILLASFVLSGCSQKNKEENESKKSPNNENYLGEENWSENKISILESASVSSMGYVYNDRVAHFVDAETGCDVVLCSKPDCTHNNRKKCDGFLLSYLDFAYIYKDKLIYVGVDEDIVGNVDVLNDKLVFMSDLDGKNKQCICEINDVQSIVRGTMYGEWLAFTYVNSFDTEDTEKVALQTLGMNRSGVYMVNVETGETRHVVEIEDYGAQCFRVFMTADKVFYTSAHYTKNIDFKEYEVSGRIDEYYQETGDALRQELYCYDIGTGVKSLIWEGKLENVLGNDEYIYITDQNKITVYKNGIPIFEESLGKLAKHNPDFINYYVCEDVLYMSDEKKVWSMNLLNGDILYIGEGGLDNKGINSILSLCGKKVYYEVIQPNEQAHIYVDNWDEFYMGNISRSVLVR